MVYYKRVQLRNHQVEEMRKAEYVGKGMNFQVSHPPSTYLGSPIWKVSEPFQLGFLWRLLYIEITG